MFQWDSKIFPNPTFVPNEGILALSDGLTLDLLIEAYKFGVFPWPMEGFEGKIPWFCPNPRAVLPTSNLKINTSLAKTFKRASFSITLNEDFEGVIRTCATIPRRGQKSTTWITEEMIAHYCGLHKLGLAQSIETRTPNGDLIGGIYGVSIGGTFSAESMFHIASGASKFALVWLCHYLHDQGVPWIDIQQQSKHLEAMGAFQISRTDFLKSWIPEAHRTIRWSQAKPAEPF